MKWPTIGHSHSSYFAHPHATHARVDVRPWPVANPVQRMTLTAEDAEAFAEALLAPPAPNPRLCALLKRQAG